jgi:hypothetical protein
MRADLPDRDGRQPRAEGSGRPQLRQLAQCPEHHVLHDIVDVRVRTERPAHDRVDQRQGGRRELLQRATIAGLRGSDDGSVIHPCGSHLTITVVKRKASYAAFSFDEAGRADVNAIRTSSPKTVMTAAVRESRLRSAFGVVTIGSDRRTARRTATQSIQQITPFVSPQNVMDGGIVKSRADQTLSNSRT